MTFGETLRIVVKGKERPAGPWLSTHRGPHVCDCHFLRATRSIVACSLIRDQNTSVMCVSVMSSRVWFSSRACSLRRIVKQNWRRHLAFRSPSRECESSFPAVSKFNDSRRAGPRCVGKLFAPNKSRDINTRAFAISKMFWNAPTRL